MNNTPMFHHCPTCSGNPANRYWITRIKRVMTMAVGLFPLTACMPSMDYNGMSPEEYSALYPKQSRVEILSDAVTLAFEPGQDTLAIEEKDKLVRFLNNVPSDAVDRISITFKVKNDARGNHLLRALRARGIAKSDVIFALSPELDKDSARIDAAYAVSVPPECPDWRKSAVTNYSNTLQSSMRCATETNLGLMVADPRDLEQGKASATTAGASAERRAQVLEKYRTDLNFGAVTAGSSPSASTGANQGGAQ